MSLLDHTAPDACTDLQQLRVIIDRIDQEIIILMGKRFAYTCSAHRFKKSELEISAPERVHAVIENIHALSEHAGLDPQITEQMYRILVDYSIKEQLKHWLCFNKLIE